MEFPCQRPTRAQLTLWKKAVGSITILGTCLQLPLGAFTADPHRPDKWFTNANSSHTIYHLQAPLQCMSAYGHGGQRIMAQRTTSLIGFLGS